MSRETRLKLGKDWKLGKIKGDYRKYYDEFKDLIDEEVDNQKFKKESNKK